MVSRPPSCGRRSTRGGRPERADVHLVHPPRRPDGGWKSGLVSRNGAKKPAFATFTRRAAQYDGREPEITLAPGTQYPPARFAALELWSRSGTGAKVGLTVTVYSQVTNRGSGCVRTAPPLSRIGYDGWISFRVPLARAIARVYSVDIRAVDIHGNRVDRSVSLRGSPGGHR